MFSKIRFAWQILVDEFLVFWLLAINLTLLWGRLFGCDDRTIMISFIGLIIPIIACGILAHPIADDCFQVGVTILFFTGLIVGAVVYEPLMDRMDGGKIFALTALSIMTYVVMIVTWRAPRIARGATEP